MTRILQAADTHRNWVRKLSIEMTDLRKKRREYADLWLQTTEHEYREDLQRINVRITSATLKQIEKTGVDVPPPDHQPTDIERKAHLMALIRYNKMVDNREDGKQIDHLKLQNCIRRILKFEAKTGYTATV
jgi:RIO-like serine/threonine protein kinase